MARDRSPLSQRLKSLAQRTGRSAEETGPESEAPASEQPAPPPAMEPTDDEQPTGEIPVVAEQPTDEQPAVQAPGDPSVPAPAGEQDEPPAPAWPTGPTMAPPVIPPSPAEPESGVADAEPEPDEPAAASPDPSAASPSDEDDEPFSPRTTIWPQSTPTPRFEPQPDAEEPKADAPTFPEASPEPDDIQAGDGDDAPTISAAAVSAPDPARAVAIEPVDAEPDAPAEAPAPDDGETGKTGVFGKLRRLRPVRTGDDAAETPAPAEAQEPAVPAEPEPEPAAATPLVLPASEEPPAKPSFGERASLRRRAKSLRARRDAGLLELGAIVLDQRRFGDPTGGSLMRRRTDELADIDSELAAIEQVLDDDGPAETVAQLGVVRCLTCSALLGPRDRFCVQCGAPRPEDAGSAS